MYMSRMKVEQLKENQITRNEDDFRNNKKPNGGKSTDGNYSL